MSDGNDPQTSPESSGGSGGLAQPASRSHVQLIQRAIRQDWPIPNDLRQACVREMGEIVKNSKSRRAKVAAVKAITTMDAINVKREAMDQKADWWQFKADAPIEDNSVNVNVLVTADDKRTGLAAIRERLGLSIVPSGHANGSGRVDHHANGGSQENQNGNGKPRGDADETDTPPS